MMIDRTGLRRGSKTRPWLVAALAAMLALGAARSASAQTNVHDLMEGRGRDVSFPVSCGADIQARFDAALAALHSFWYGQALKEFIAIAEAKPDCAMAYWGIAMSVWNQIWAPPTPANLKKGSDAITQALALDAKTPRERDYLDALAAFYADYDKLDHRTRAAAYMRKMEALAQRYADDREARIFYALSLLATADGLDKTYKNQLKAGEILEQVFAERFHLFWCDATNMSLQLIDLHDPKRFGWEVIEQLRAVRGEDYLASLILWAYFKLVGQGFQCPRM